MIMGLLELSRHGRQVWCEVNMKVKYRPNRSLKMWDDLPCAEEGVHSNRKNTPILVSQCWRHWCPFWETTRNQFNDWSAVGNLDTQQVTRKMLQWIYYACSEWRYDTGRAQSLYTRDLHFVMNARTRMYATGSETPLSGAGTSHVRQHYADHGYHLVDTQITKCFFNKG